MAQLIYIAASLEMFVLFGPQMQQIIGQTLRFYF